MAAASTCDCPGGTQPKFKTEFQRDGILRVTKVVNELTVSDQATSGYNNLGSWTYGYDSASNALSAAHAGDAMNELESTQHYDYDTLNRLVSARVTDTQDWTAAAEETTSYQYDDLGNRQSHSYRDATAIAYGHDPGLAALPHCGRIAGRSRASHAAACPGRIA